MPIRILHCRPIRETNSSSSHAFVLLNPAVFRRKNIPYDEWFTSGGIIDDKRAVVERNLDEYFLYGWGHYVEPHAYRYILAQALEIGLDLKWFLPSLREVLGAEHYLPAIKWLPNIDHQSVWAIEGEKDVLREFFIRLIYHALKDELLGIAIGNDNDDAGPYQIFKDLLLPVTIKTLPILNCLFQGKITVSRPKPDIFVLIRHSWGSTAEVYPILKSSASELGGLDASLQQKALLGYDFLPAMSPLLSEKTLGRMTKFRIHLPLPQEQETYTEENLYFPEQIDIKITDFCEEVCPFCHESSSPKGHHASFNVLSNFLDYCGGEVAEVALGGGNPLSHPDLLEILRICQEEHLAAAITARDTQWLRYPHVGDVPDNTAIGISVSKIKNAIAASGRFYTLEGNIIFHLINGVHSTSDVLSLLKERHVLILGFKEFGRGVTYQRRSSMDAHQILEAALSQNYRCVAFDHLALEQLNIRQVLQEIIGQEAAEQCWKVFYGGDDGTYSMYVDAVQEEAAINSYSPVRVSFPQQKPWNFVSLLFREVQKVSKEKSGESSK